MYARNPDIIIQEQAEAIEAALAYIKKLETTSELKDQLIDLQLCQVETLKLVIDFAEATADANLLRLIRLSFQKQEIIKDG